MFWKKIKYSLKRKKKIFEISSNSELDLLYETFQDEKLFSVDTEFDWRNTYFPILSLIQIGFKEKIFIIDCLKVNPKDTLQFPLESSEYLKIFHAVRSDTTVIKNCLKINAKNIFDIQVAESFLNNGVIAGYGSIVQKYTKQNLDKSETNSNWLKRPLNANQITYAAEDVEYLIDIYNYQKKSLQKKSILESVFKKSREEACLGNKEIKLARLEKRKKKLSKREQKIFLWREEIAKIENVPPGFLFKDKDLKRLCNFKKNENKLESKIMKIIGDTKWSQNFITNFL